MVSDCTSRLYSLFPGFDIGSPIPVISYILHETGKDFEANRLASNNIGIGELDGQWSATVQVFEKPALVCCNTMIMAYNAFRLPMLQSQQRRTYGSGNRLGRMDPKLSSFCL